MKRPGCCLIVALFISTFGLAQNPYARFDDEVLKIFNPFQVHKGQEEEFFAYAVKLYTQDSLRKAGQLFDRVYWIDTSSSLAKQSLSYRKKIEQKVFRQTQDNLNNSWNWKWSGTGWGATDSATTSKTKKMQLDGNTIKFFVNAVLTRQTTYVLTQSIDWLQGFLINKIRYLDTNEEWYFNLGLFDVFTSDALVIELNAGVTDAGGEAYQIEKRIK